MKYMLRCLCLTFATHEANHCISDARLRHPNATRRGHTTVVIAVTSLERPVLGEEALDVIPLDVLRQIATKKSL